MANKSRPNRRAASKTHFFKYQLAGDPNRAEENDLKRALQESLLEQFSKSTTINKKKSGKKINHSIVINTTTPNCSSGEVSGSTNNSSNKSSFSNQSAGSLTSPTSIKRTRSSINGNGNGSVTVNNNHHHHHSTTTSATTTPQQQLKKRAKTNHISTNETSSRNISTRTTGTNTSSGSGGNNSTANDGFHRSAPAILIVADSRLLTTTTSTSTSTNTTPFMNNINNKAIKTYSRNNVNHNNNEQQIQASISNGPKSSTPIKNTIGQRLNDKITPTQTSKPSKSQTNNCVISKSTQSIICPSSRDSQSVEFSQQLLHHDTTNLSLNKKNQNQSSTNVKVINKRLPQGSWSLLGIPEEKTIYMREDEPPKRLICYPAIKHVEGDVIQVRDSVLLRSGARKTDLPYIAKVCSFWEDAETGNVMMSLFWYYRPEHTEEGRKPHHLVDEIFASRHRDVDSVECIEDKCYVLTFNEYCRYRKRCKMEQANTTWSLTDVTIPVSNELYPRKNRIPDSDVNPELVFCCRQIYDSRLKRLVKNPLINPKYGHI